jgi:hypothetical protein
METLRLVNSGAEDSRNAITLSATQVEQIKDLLNFVDDDLLSKYPGIMKKFNL